jgi:hypothetical protein
MKHIEVTSGMHDRIMKNIEEADISKMKDRAPFFKVYRKYISIAACIVILLAGTFIVYSSLTKPNNPPVQINNGIVDCGSLGELSEAVGFKVQEVKTFPFDIDQTVYASYWGKLAQITYSGKSNTLIFRMSLGSEDNSGDYNEYGDVKNCPADGYSVTIKGESCMYNLAVWENGGYSFSINIPGGVSEEAILKAALSVR